MRTAALQGAVVANYVEAVGFEKESGLVRGVRALDRLGGRELRIRARQTLNAAGPWGDAVRRLAGDDAGPSLRPTKGVHLVAPGRGLTAAFLLLHPADGRVFFVIPWLGKTLIGTTDTVCDDPPDRVRVEPADVDYLLRGHNHYFAPHLSPNDVLGSFVGLRPLVRARPGEPSALSREFALSASPSGLLTVSGGKYTTYRRMAEVVIDAVVRRLGLRRRCRTRDLRLDGAPREPWELFESAEVKRVQSRWFLSKEDAAHLVGRYGARAGDVAESLGRDPALRGRVVEGEADLLAEFAYQRDHEMAMTAADCLLRRTRLGLFRPELLRTPPPRRPAPGDERATAAQPSATASSGRRLFGEKDGDGGAEARQHGAAVEFVRGRQAADCASAIRTPGPSAGSEGAPRPAKRPPRNTPRSFQTIPRLDPWG